jgi:hypothetical protein
VLATAATRTAPLFFAIRPRVPDTMLPCLRACPPSEGDVTHSCCRRRKERRNEGTKVEVRRTRKGATNGHVNSTRANRNGSNNLCPGINHAIGHCFYAACGTATKYKHREFRYQPAYTLLAVELGCGAREVHMHYDSTSHNHESAGSRKYFRKL